MNMLAMKAPSDLFEDGLETVKVAAPEPDITIVLGEPIAVPCGFVDRTNKRCRRLGDRPVMVEGVQLVSHGRPMLHCDPTCFSAFGLERTTTVDSEWP